MIRALLTLLISLLWVTGALATERITDFDVEIIVEVEGDIIVTERIAVISEGYEIKRGIFRELPRYYEYEGVSLRYDYDLISITRDGREENYTRLSEGNAIVWRIGNADVFLEDGPHVYEIKYRVGDQVRHHYNKQEIYWNATGTYWDFPIETVSATIRFPEGAEIIESAAYTGRLGTRGVSDMTTTRTAGPVITFITEQGLTSREGLTVAAAVAPGVLAPMSDARKRQLFVIRYGGYPFATLLFGALFWFYYRKWDQVGRDPLTQPVFPRYAPPAGYGPAAVNIIYERRLKGMDWFTAELMQLAHQGHVEITAEKKLTKIKRLTDGPPKGSEGRKLLDHVIKHKVGRTLKLGKDITNKRFHRSLLDYTRQLEKAYVAPYYKGNGGWVFVGLLLTFGLMFIFALLPVARSHLALPLFLGMIALNIVFFFLLKARSVKGEQVSSEIEGFRLYLKTAEADRINTANPLGETPPAMSVKLYERFLPYAIALGVEKPWTKQFERTMPIEAKAYTPQHISGSQISSGRPLNIGKAVAAGLTTGVAAAAPVSVSSGSSGGFSSGSSGGGSSGGGGGGGGGGGW
jgi:uncharacterized membrane protein